MQHEEESRRDGERRHGFMIHAQRHNRTMRRQHEYYDTFFEESFSASRNLASTCDLTRVSATSTQDS